MKFPKNLDLLYNILIQIKDSDWELLKEWIQLLDNPIKNFLSELAETNVESAQDVKKSVENHLLTAKDIDHINSLLNIFYIKIKSSRSETNLSFLSKLSYTNRGYTYFFDKLKEELKEENIMYPEFYIYQNKIESIEVAISDQFRIEMFSKMNLDLVQHFVHKEILRILYYLSVKQVTAADKNDFTHIVDNLNKVIEIYQIKSSEIDILLQTLKISLEMELTDFDELLVKLSKGKLLLEVNDINTIYSILVNTLYHNLKVWARTEEDLLSIYESKYQYYNSIFYDTITASQIKNIATLCIRVDKIDWFREVFKRENILNLSLDNEDALILCDAKFLFHQKKYKESIAILNLYKTHDIFQELELRRLQVMCFYELGERVLVDNYLNTFKVFIHRNDTINTVYKESNNNFIRLLIRLNKSIDYKKTEVILNDYSKMDRISEKQWVNDKITQLLQKLNEEIN